MSHVIDLVVDNIEKRYDPENDLIPNAPSVTWTDIELLRAIVSLQEQIDQFRIVVSRLQYDIEGRK